MSNIWDQSRIQQHIVQEIEESLTLDYKAAGSLSKTDGKKKEITKDVSAMANAAGWIIIYGVSEYQEPDKKHLPEKIDSIDQTRFPKEWLEQVINNIRPKIDGLVIQFALQNNDVQGNIFEGTFSPQQPVTGLSGDPGFDKGVARTKFVPIGSTCSMACSVAAGGGPCGAEIVASTQGGFSSLALQLTITIP